MPMRSDPTAATAKWVTAMQGSSAAMTRGVQAVTVAPGTKAAAAADKWLAKVTAAQDKWKRNVAGVSLQSWQQSMTAYGISRVSAGAQAKQGKMLAHMEAFLPHVAAGLQTINAMPSTTLEDGIQRAVAMMRWNAKYSKGLGSRPGA